jgi:hypothetical protein
MSKESDSEPDTFLPRWGGTRILGCPVVLLDKGLADDGVTFGICRFEERGGVRSLERYSRKPFSAVGAEELFCEARERMGTPYLALTFLLSTESIQQICFSLKVEGRMP